MSHTLGGGYFPLVVGSPIVNKMIFGGLKKDPSNRRSPRLMSRVVLIWVYTMAGRIRTWVRISRTSAKQSPGVTNPWKRTLRPVAVVDIKRDHLRCEVRTLLTCKGPKMI